MTITSHYPVNPLLKAHIEYYYFQKTESDNFSAEYYSFPNTTQSLNIHRNVSCAIDGQRVKVTGINERNFTLILQGKFELPLHVEQSGKLDKITIAFRPLGINHFIRSAFGHIGAQATQLFIEWDDAPQQSDFLTAFFDSSDNARRIQILESHLLTLFIPLKDGPLLQHALNLLTDFTTEWPVEMIAEKLELNTRTFNRLFYKHLGISPIGYRKIARFRESLKNKLGKHHADTLTQIGYESNYYDQSYFNRIYRQLTGEPPSRFFHSIDKLADDKVIFQFVKK